MKSRSTFIFTFALLGTLGSSSCDRAREFSDASAFMSAYASHEWVDQKQCIQGHCFQSRLQSPSSITAREWQQGILTDSAAAQQRQADLRGQLFFVYSIEGQDGSTLPSHWQQLTKNSFHLQQGEQKIPCSFLYDETVPGLHPGRNLHLLFDMEDQQGRGELLLVLDHPPFGIAQFKYSLSDINELPRFTLKTTRS